MTPEERQNLIRDMIQTRYNMKISELSQIFSVSEMTIHRDIKLLIDEGLVIKTYGGITLVRKNPGVYQAQDECVYCHRKIDERLVYRMILTENRIENACCGHCGLLRHSQLDGEVIQAICYDFLTGTTVSAHLTWFVLDTEVDIRCCQPQVLAFENKNFAERFTKGFGGTVYGFQEAVRKIKEKVHCSCCKTE